MFGFQSEAIFLATHTGTHVDAPSHFRRDGAKMDEIPVDRLVGSAVLLDLTHKGQRELIRAKDLEATEEAGRISIKEGDIAILRLGWEKVLGKPTYVLDYPGLSEDAADHLAAKRVSAVGVDSPSIDHPDDKKFPAHNILLGRGILVIENLCNLHSLEKNRFRFIALPLKIRGATGSPVRAIAIEE